MASAAFNNNIFNPTYQTVHTGLRSFFSLGAKISKKLELVKLIDKIGLAILKGLSYFPGINEYMPISAVELPLKDGKIVTDFFMGFRSLEAFMTGKFAETKEILAINVSGLALMFFSTVNALSRLKVDVSPIINTAKKVPVFGVLPFAGLLNLSLVTMFGAIFFQAQAKKAKLELGHAQQSNGGKKIIKNKPDFQKKIREWSEPLDEEKVSQRITYHAKKYKGLPANASQYDWTSIQNDLNEGKNLGEIGEFTLKKKAKWEKKLEKCNLEIASQRLTMTVSAAKVSSILAVSAVAIAAGGMPAAAFPFMLSAAKAATAYSTLVGLLEAGCGLKNYILKKSIENYKFEPVHYIISEK